MNKLRFCLFVAAATASAPALAQNAAPPTTVAQTAPAAAAPEYAVWIEGKRVVIPAGTPIKMQIEQAISGKKARVGDPLDFTVTEDVKIGDVVVFKKGAPAKGEVSFAKDAGNWNKSSQLEIDVWWTTAADGRQIPTATRFKERARNAKLNQVMTFGLLSPFTKGKNANVKKGAKYDVTVGSEIAVEPVAEEKKDEGKATPKK